MLFYYGGSKMEEVNMRNNSIVFKGSLDSLIVIMKEEVDFETILEEMEEKISSNERFFKGDNIKMKYRGKKLSEEEKKKIF